MVSNDSELSNSARNSKKKFGSRRRFSAAASVNGGKTNVSLYSHSYMVITNHHTQNKICKVNRRPRKHTSKLGFKNRHCCPPPLENLILCFTTQFKSQKTDRVTIFPLNMFRGTTPLPNSIFKLGNKTEESTF